MEGLDWGGVELEGGGGEAQGVEVGGWGQVADVQGGWVGGG